MNKKTLMKKLSSLLIILAILIQMFPIATYAQENATHTSRVRHVRALRTTPETYVKFQIATNAGDVVVGKVGYKLVEVNGSSETIFKNGFLNTANKEVEFSNLKLNTTYKMYITEVPNTYERPVQSVAEFYFDTSGIHFTKGGSGIFIKPRNTTTKLTMGVHVQDTAGNAIQNRNAVKFELKKGEDYPCWRLLH